MLFKTLLSLAMILSTAQVYASSELDAEIQSLELQLRPIKRAEKRVVARPRVVQAPTPVPSTYRRVQPRPVKKVAHANYQSAEPTDPQTTWDNESAQSKYRTHFQATNDVESSPEVSGYVSASSDDVELRNSNKGTGMIPKVTALAMGSLSTVDGPDRESVIPANVSNSITGGFSGAVLVDVNLLGDRNMVFESGVEMLSTGSLTGYQVPNYYNTVYAGSTSNQTSFDEQFNLTYLGVPINFKYYFNSSIDTGFYAKAGAMPAFMMTKKYNNFGATFLNESRYGEFSSFDVIFQGAVGFNYNITRDFVITAELGGFQGILPIASNFSIYNVGGLAGLGISYFL